MNIQVSGFGSAKGESVDMFTLTNANSMEVKILSFGGIIKEINLPDASGKPTQCVQTFDSLNDYIADESYRGAIVGRYANRIGNGCFTLDGQDYRLDKNNGEHCLHGGNAGFHKRIWEATSHFDDNVACVELTLRSEEGEGGFPGNVVVKARYTLDNNNALRLTIHATTDKATPLSFTQHAYFTLSNADSVKSTVLKINANKVTDADATLLPTGEFIDVKNTPFDFTEPTEIGNRVHNTPGHKLFDIVGGYDHNYVLNNNGSGQAQAQVFAADTGLKMQLFTTLPGLQFYTGNLRNDKQMGALCLEPQYFPDSPNKPHFPSCIATPEKPANMEICYVFSVS